MSAGTNVSTEATQPRRRKPGGQPGNANALKLKRGQFASAHEVPEQSEWECRTHGCAASTASIPKTSPLPNAGACKRLRALSSGMRSACCVSSFGVLQSRSRPARTLPSMIRLCTWLWSARLCCGWPACCVPTTCWAGRKAAPLLPSLTSPLKMLHRRWRSMGTEATLYSFRFVLFGTNTHGQTVRGVWQRRWFARSKCVMITSVAPGHIHK